MFPIQCIYLLFKGIKYLHRILYLLFYSNVWLGPLLSIAANWTEPALSVFLIFGIIMGSITSPQSLFRDLVPHQAPLIWAFLNIRACCILFSASESKTRQPRTLDSVWSGDSGFWIRDPLRCVSKHICRLAALCAGRTRNARGVGFVFSKGESVGLWLCCPKHKSGRKRVKGRN